MLAQYYSQALLALAAVELTLGLELIFIPLNARNSFVEYDRSRWILSAVYLLLGLSSLAFGIFRLRVTNPALATAMSISVYHLCTWAMAATYIPLLDRLWLNRRKFVGNTAVWFAGFVLSLLALILPDMAMYLFVAASAIILIHLIYLAVQFIKEFVKSIRFLKENYSDDVEKYLFWTGRSGFILIAFGAAGSVLNLASTEANVIYSLVGILVFAYVFRNFISFSSHVDSVFKAMPAKEEDEIIPVPEDKADSVFGDVCKRLDAWIASGGYLQCGITTTSLAKDVCTNRPYVSRYFNEVKGVPFRTCINNLRFEKAKQLLAESSFSVEYIAQAVGFDSSNKLFSLFKEMEGMTPTAWRIANKK